MNFCDTGYDRRRRAPNLTARARRLSSSRSCPRISSSTRRPGGSGSRRTADLVDDRTDDNECCSAPGTYSRATLRRKEEFNVHVFDPISPSCRVARLRGSAGFVGVQKTNSTTQSGARVRRAAGQTDRKRKVQKVLSRRVACTPISPMT